MNNKLLSNDEIRQIYLKNQSSKSDDWMVSLFSELEKIAISRFRKKKFFSTSEDLKQELFTSLWLAIKTFDCHKNFDFYRWASWHFNNGFERFLSQNQETNSINLDDNYAFPRDGEPENIVLVKQILLDNKDYTEREKLVVYYSIVEERTLGEIGKALSLSAERIRQVRDSALNKIRKSNMEKE